jgi:hypothetical protein
MNSCTTTPFSISSLRQRATTFGLAAVVSLGLLAGMDGVADKQYEAAHVAQLSVDTAQVASTAPQRTTGSALLHESV